MWSAVPPVGLDICCCPWSERSYCCSAAEERALAECSPHLQSVTQIKTEPLLVKGEFSGALPNIVPAIRWLFEILEGNNFRRLFYNIWSVQVPVILLYVHTGSAGKSKTVQSLPVDTSVLSPKYVSQRTREAIEIIPKLNVNTIKWVWDDVQYRRQCESMKLRKMNH